MPRRKENQTRTIPGDVEISTSSLKSVPLLSIGGQSEASLSAKYLLENDAWLVDDFGGK